MAIKAAHLSTGNAVLALRCSDKEVQNKGRKVEVTELWVESAGSAVSHMTEGGVTWDLTIMIMMIIV